MIRVFTAFSGYDSQCLALNVLRGEEDNPIIHSKDGYMYIFDYELVGWSEIDKFAIKAHNALFPQWADRNFGDISKIDWEQVPDFDLFTYILNENHKLKVVLGILLGCSHLFLFRYLYQLFEVDSIFIPDNFP